MAQPNRRVTRKDVAQRAGVSETIVSYVLNNNRYVDKEKRARVLAAVEELRYRPNVVARALKGKPSGHILFIVDNPANERLSVLMGYMDRCAYGRGAMLSLCATRNEPDFIRQILSQQFDGVIISSTGLRDEYIQQLVDAGLPVVLLLTRDYPGVHGAASIGTGLYHGVFSCVEYFVAHGRKDILYIDRVSKRGNFSDPVLDSRLRGFIAAMQAQGLSAEGRVIAGCADEAEAQRAIAETVKTRPVNAVLGRNDRLACAALQQLLRMGLQVPKDVMVIGFDDSSIARYVSPQMTSMRMPDEQLAEAAVNTLYDLRSGIAPPQELRFEATMIVRQSTEVLPAKE